MIECKECLIKKEFDCFYKHPMTKSGYMGRCIECVLNGRRTEKEASMSRIRDRIRYHNNNKRRLYTIRRGMISRCYDLSNPRYHCYGKLGISVERNSFDDFYKDMAQSFEDHKVANVSKHKRIDTTIDRMNVKGNYSKSNCRRATYKEQANNRSNNK